VRGAVFLFFFCLWLVISGETEPFLLACGLGASAVVTFVALALNRTPINITKLVSYYIPLVLYDTFISSFFIMKDLCSTQVRPKIKFVTIDRPTNDTVAAILCDSIAVTPGTVAVECRPHHLTVCCYNEAVVESIDGSKVISKITLLHKP
jgi:multisubunit Na+/H+ antiporter MnhE subunit